MRLAADDHASSEYWPAYMLADWTLERAGRVKASVSANNSTSTNNLKSASLARPVSEKDMKEMVNISLSGDDSSMEGMLTTVDSIDPSIFAEGCELQDPKLSPEEAVGRVQTASMIIIGDEILSGFTDDVNLLAAAKSLGSIGIPLKMVSVVSDDIDDIANEIRRMSQKFDIVITSGAHC